jgi:putative phosphoribosyl transferase
MLEQLKDREQAGRLLAEKLIAYKDRADVLVLALPRGGVSVGYEIARALDAPLDVFVVRKLGVPGYRELALGAIASGGVRVLNEDVVEALNISPANIEQIAAEEQKELERRERAYRSDRPAPSVQGRTVILVDDGIATGSTLRAAIEAIRSLRPARLVVAAGVAPMSTFLELRSQVDEIVCLITPYSFAAIGLLYERFTQVSDEEVTDLLERAARRKTPSAV